MMPAELGEKEFRFVLEATLAKLHGVLNEIRGSTGLDNDARSTLSEVDTWQKSVLARALAVAMPGARANVSDTEMPEFVDDAFEQAGKLASAVRAVEGVRELYANFRLLEHSPSV